MPSTSSSEQQLVAALDNYEKLVFSICYKITKSYFDAEDLTQETFLTYYKSLDRFDGENEKAYLAKIASNKCLDFLRKNKNQAAPVEHEILENNAGLVPPPEKEVMERQLSENLLQACNQLKPPYKQVAVAYYCHGHTAKEISDTNGVKLKTIQTQIGRAKKMLKKYIKKEELA